MNEQLNNLETADESFTDPGTGWDVRMANQMARSILAAHEENPNSWVLHSWNNEPYLGIGQVSVVSAGPTQPFAYLVMDEDLSADQRTIVDRFSSGRTYSNYPWAKYLKVPSAQVETMVELLEESHREAVRRLTQDIRKAQRGNDHRADLVQKLEDISGISLPEPAYIDDISRSIALIGGFDPGAAWDPAMLEELAKSILAAHAVNPASWDVRYYRNEIVLDIAMPKVMAISKDLGHFLITGAPDDAQTTDIDAAHLSLGRASGNASSWVHTLDRDAFVKVLGTHRSAHEAIVSTLALSVKNMPGRAKQHRQDIVGFIAEATGMELPEPAYKHGEELNRTPNWSTASAPDGALTPLKAIEQQFFAKGLSYTPAQIATFYTALQTKGFVVLSGISGTGKSKIAQHFVEMLPIPSMERNNHLPIPLGIMSFQLSDTQNWAAIDATQAAYFPPLDYDVRQSVEYEFRNELISGHAILRVLAGGKPTLYLALGRDLTNRLRHFVKGGRVYARIELNDDGASISQVQLSQEANNLIESDSDDSDGEALRNNLFLAVRPDWRDSTSLLGYYNPLTETYEWTDFLRFILQAIESFQAQDGLAWFVILDEMNLAHVEYYFADLLSIIESGRTPDGFSHDPIRLTYPDTLADNVPPREVYLPPNLYIIGTVNMDETTHAFSPKVLDRAFTIELTEVDFTNYPPISRASGYSLTEDDRKHLLNTFTRDGAFARISKSDIAAVVEAHPQLRTWLSSLNILLADDRFHFGYRVFDEIAQFVFNADENGMFTTWEDAFDQAVFMKVLPKFNGSRSRLHSPLVNLAAWAVNPEMPDTDALVGNWKSLLSSSAANFSPLITSARFPRVAKRALQMLTTLEEDGFVSFG